ncbi:MAG: hypothetical protein JW904_02055 [Spirochaetales bacterium]|nr:hypothetical protein [Spirochaetales bacterium]
MGKDSIANSAFRLEYAIHNAVNIEKIKKLIVVREEKGYVVEKNTVSEWIFTGYFTRNQQHFLYGTTGKVVSLRKKIEGSRKTALKAMFTLIKALQVVSQDGSRQYEVGLDTIYFTETDGVLFLPATIIRKLKDTGTEEFRRDFHTISNPYFVKQQERAVYAVETLLFYTLTGHYPFVGETDEDLRNKIRNMNIVSPKSFLPEMKPDVARQFEVFFNTKNQCVESLPRLEKTVSLWIAEDVTQTILPQEREAILNEAKRRQKTSGKTLQRKLFWEKNGKRILFGSIGAILGGIFLFMFASIYFQPRETKGFIPEKVVETYYKSINSMDADLIKDCYIDGVGDQMEKMLMTIYPLDRQNLALFGYNLAIPADEWIANGKPEPRAYQFVFGVGNLVLKDESRGDYPVFFAEYDFFTWDRDPNNPDNEQNYQLVYHVQERLYLAQDQEDWVINRIDELARDLVEVKDFGKQLLEENTEK